MACISARCFVALTVICDNRKGVFFMSYDPTYMQMAIDLAWRGEGFANPNPMVGCVLVKDGIVVGQGWHACFGQPHAERNAVADCLSRGLSPRGAEAYVTLEPCCHHGKQPPCSDLLIEQGVSKVYVGIDDPNPKVAGHGIAQLREAGIEVEVGFLQDQIREQNKAFLKLFTTRMPYVLMKSAMTLDGKIATRTGDSKWVSCDESRAMVHHLRHRMMAICVGIGTVLVDDPLLNCRHQVESPCHPIRIVVDSTARIPLDSQLVRTAEQYPLWVAHTQNASEEKLIHLREKGVRTICCDSSDGHVSVSNLLHQIANPSDSAQPAIDSLLLEGGASLNAAFLRSGCVDEVNLFVAPKLVGGNTAPSPIADLGVLKMSEALQLRDIECHAVGTDLLIKAKPIK